MKDSTVLWFRVVFGDGVLQRRFSLLLDQRMGALAFFTFRSFCRVTKLAQAGLLTAESSLFSDSWLNGSLIAVTILLGLLWLLLLLAVLKRAWQR